jgi:hypothetical protein
VEFTLSLHVRLLMERRRVQRFWRMLLKRYTSEPDNVLRLPNLMTDAIALKFINAPLSEAQFTELVRIP